MHFGAYIKAGFSPPPQTAEPVLCSLRSDVAGRLAEARLVLSVKVLRFVVADLWASHGDFSTSLLWRVRVSDRE